MRKAILLAAIIFLTTTGFLKSQAVQKPNFALKSHETLEIKSIETDSRSTEFLMTIENRINAGTFCADKNIFIIYPDGSRIRMKSSNGIPNCPTTYKFKSVGEKLDFTLTFPHLKQGTEWIDLIEECSENCFYFYGITLNNDLNRKIDEAFARAEMPDKDSAMTGFINILEETDKKDLGSEGLLYINIITLAAASGESVKAEEWYNRFKRSNAPRLAQYMRFLNDRGIKY